MWVKQLFSSNFLKYSAPVLGAVVTLPCLAVGQAAFFLARYRKNHKETPYPKSPSQGIVIAKSNKEENDSLLNRTLIRKAVDWWHNWRTSCNANLDEENEMPLSLLVIGDSLAAGVGSISGTPKLPEAIARSLSRALGGRPVLWTCHGTPGATTSQIIQDIVRISGEHCDDRNSCDRSTALDSNQFTNISKISKGMSRNSHYDIVVVFTGVNDLKQLILPFMHDGRANENDFKEELKRMFFILSERIKSNIGRLKLSSVQKDSLQSGDKDESSNDFGQVLCRRHHDPESSQLLSRNHKPLVVIPGLPAGPIPVLKYPPLSWITHSLCELIDNQKRALSVEYPDDVLFVEAASIQMFDDIERGRSELVKKRNTEILLLDLKDSFFQARDKSEQVIQNHVDITSCCKDDEKEEEMELNYETSLQENLSNRMQNFIGSTLIAFDGVHPNDDGYDYWGRQIAEEIIESWKV